jgi:hypothetical protein
MGWRHIEGHTGKINEETLSVCLSLSVVLSTVCSRNYGFALSLALHLALGSTRQIRNYTYTMELPSFLKPHMLVSSDCLEEGPWPPSDFSEVFSPFVLSSASPHAPFAQP